MLDNFIQLLVAPNVERAEPLEKVAQVVHHRVPEDFGAAILLPTESLGQVLDQLGKLFDKRLLGQPDGFFKPGLNSLAFLPVEFRAELPQVGRQLD